MGALCVASTILELACGGTTGREGLPDQELDSGQDATVPLDAHDRHDADLDVRSFDVTILYADVVLPDVNAPPPDADAGEAGYPWPNCPPFLSISGFESDGAPVQVPPNSELTYIPSEYDDAGQIVEAPDGSLCASYGWLGSVPTDECAAPDFDFVPFPSCNWCADDAGVAAAGPGVGSPRYGLCLALYACILRTGCGNPNAISCLCGVQQAGAQNYSANCYVDAGGPCATEELAALEALPGSAGVEAALKNYTADPGNSGGTCGSGLNQLFYAAGAANPSCFPCQSVGTKTEATPNTAAGTCPAGQSNTLKDKQGDFCCAGAATGDQ
jgi:hypothetical protein